MPSNRRHRFDDDDDRPRRRRWEDDDDDEPPRLARRKKSGNRMVLSIAIIVGGLAVCGLIVALVVAQVGRKTGGGRGGDDENAVRPGQVGFNIDNGDYATPRGIEKHLGPGRVVPQGEWATIRMTNDGSDGKEERSLAGWMGYYPGKPVPTVYHWSTPHEDLYVAYWPPAEAIAMSPKRTAVTYGHHPGEKPYVMTHSGY